MADFDELRLKIALDDRASAGLAKIRSEIIALGDYNLRLSRQFQGQTLQLTAVMRPLISGSLSSRNALNLLGRSYGPTAVLAGGLGYAAVAMTSKMTAFSDEIIKVGARARALGVAGGDFANLSKQLVNMGMSQPQAQRFLTSYIEGITRLQDANKEFEAELKRMAGTASDDMHDWIKRQLGFVQQGNYADAINEWMRGVGNDYLEALNDPKNIGGEAEAAAIRARFARKWGIDPETLVQYKGRLTNVTDIQRTHWDMDEASATGFSSTILKLREQLDEFNKGKMSSMAEHFARISQRFDTGKIDSERWGRVIGANLNQIVLKVADFGRAATRVVGWWNNFMSGPRGPEPVVGLNLGQGMPSANFWEPREKVTVAPLGVVALQEGGIVTKPTLAMLGEAGPEAVVPLSSPRAPLAPTRTKAEWGTSDILSAVGGIAGKMGFKTTAAVAKIAATGTKAAADLPTSMREARQEALKFAFPGIFNWLEGMQADLAQEEVQESLKGIMPEAAVNALVGFATGEGEGPAPRGVFSGMFQRRQVGGPVEAGQNYLVGEAGAETFVPRGGERDMRQNIYETRDNREALAENERPTKSLADQLRSLNDWMQTKVGVGAPGYGKADVAAAMGGAATAAAGGGYGVGADFGTRKLDSDIGPDTGAPSGGRYGGGGAGTDWRRTPGGIGEGVGPGSGAGAGQSSPSGKGAGRAIEHGGGNLKGVDPRLMHILNEAAKDMPEGWRVQIRSGKDARGGRSQHPSGFAIDIALMDPEGAAKYGNKIIGGLGKQVKAGKGWVPWLQSPEAYKTYEHFAYIARKQQQKLYPELNNKFAWGGWFGRGSAAFMDLMHFSTGGEGGSAGSWDKGLKPEYAREWGIDNALPSQIKYGEESAQEKDDARRTQGTDDTQPQGTSPQETSPQGTPPQATPPTGGGGGIRDVLAEQRERIKQELANNPQLRQRMVQLAQAENAKSPQHVMETMVNRAIASGKPLRDVIDPSVSKAARDYYAPYHKGGARYSAAGKELARGAQERVNAMVDDVLAGSNVSRLATHQGSAGVGARAKARGEATTEAGGETYYRKDINANLHGAGVVKREKNWAQATLKAAEDRKEIDTAMGTQAKAKTEADVTLTANVNAPDGTKVTMKGEGAVTSTEVNRAKKSGKLETAQESSQESEKEAA